MSLTLKKIGVNDNLADFIRKRCRHYYSRSPAKAANVYGLAVSHETVSCSDFNT
ncbi:hypothetical protein PS691_01522 [Pseudomonas fluorescens]|uniref:Uncharacterized protein n=1 Tax=Pseudomonas fluorescens TaxID=294 RepID=A0A5E7BNY6_PSEFL|nr:hypothetical protein PS691_01522 [Pseudomonas fluorescens]